MTIARAAVTTAYLALVMALQWGAHTNQLTFGEALGIQGWGSFAYLLVLVSLPLMGRR